MLEAMMRAEVGDDVFREDPTVNALEEKIAGMFSMEAALYVPSGTMANQLAIKMHTSPLEEMICAYDAHVYQYEVGGYAFHSQIAVNPLSSTDGLLNPDQVVAAIKPRQDWLPITSLVTIENSSNRTGGNIYKLPQIKDLYTLCQAHHLKFHIDGARIFNAILAGGYSASDIGAACDSMSICLSKGLGAPVGSVLLSSKSNIAMARRLRKAYGGGMRQAGILAAAGIYALENNIDNLLIDHRHAQVLKKALDNVPYVESIKKVETNIVILDLIPPITANQFISELKKNNILASKFGPGTVRLTTHLDISDTDIEKVCAMLARIDLAR